MRRHFGAISMNHQHYTTEPFRTLPNEKNGTAAGQRTPTPLARKRRLAVSHADYWLGRIRRRTYRVKGPGDCLCQAPEWSVRLRLGADVWFNLQTSNKDAAAAQA